LNLFLLKSHSVIADAKSNDRLVSLLKLRGPLTTAELAEACRVRAP